jgi:hypothetical protein
MDRKRGATLVEMIFTMSLAAMVVATTTTLYAFVAIRAGDSVTKYNSYQQSKDLMTAMSDVTSNAISCTNVTIGSVTALKCTMPNAGIDRDGNGIFDQYNPSGVYKTLKESYTAGKRIWFVQSTSPVAIGTTGKFWYRACRSDDTTIVAADVDAKWSYVTGTTPRIYIPGTVTFTQTPAMYSTTVAIALDTSINPNAAVKGFSGNLGNKIPAVSFSRRFFWRSAY